MSAIVPKPPPYNSRLTVAMAKDALYDLVDPSDKQSPRFMQKLNEACERIINSGKWKGIYAQVTFYYTDYGYIWLPAEYQSVIGMRYKRVPFPSFTQQYEYMENGPGEVDDATRFTGSLIDMGDGFPTQNDLNDVMDINDLASWRVYCSSTDNGKKVRIFGKNTVDPNVTPFSELFDASGNPGINVTLQAPYVTLTIPSGQSNPTVITGVQKPVTVNNVYLKAVDTDGAIYTLGSYEPRDVNPMFRRYRTGTLENTTTQDAIHTICQRRYVPVVADTDWVIPGNISALRNAIRSLMFEESNQDQEADKTWGKCLQLLNDEARASRAAGRPLVNFQLFGPGSPIPSAN